MVPAKNDDGRPAERHEQSPVGGDDPDFVIPPGSRPVLCAIPGLRSVLPQCRRAETAQV